MKTFIFLEWYGILLLRTLYEVYPLEKIHPVCNIPEITHSARDYHYGIRIARATATVAVL